MRIYFLCLLLGCTHFAFSQEQLEAFVVDSQQNPIVGAHIDLDHRCTVTDDKGMFFIDSNSINQGKLKIVKEGYEPYYEQIDKNNIPTFFQLSLEGEELAELVIDTYHLSTKNSENLASKDLWENYSGGFAQSIAQTAGVEVSNIGSQNGKISMRGMQQNRLAVVENGTKIEGQQWGADHGLEVDALQTENVEVVKGVGTIAYGSDAIAGVVQIDNESIPKKGWSVKTQSSYKSNSKAIAQGLSLSYGAPTHHFFKLKGSFVRYADFEIPTSSIRYLNTVIPIHDQKLTNTAGKELNFMGQWGYYNSNFKHVLTFSQFRSTSGFFSGAHGIPNIKSTYKEGSDYAIELPYQSVVHSKIGGNASYQGAKHQQWNFIWGYQLNHRQELSNFHTHFPNQPKPEDALTEFDFRLHTVDLKLTYENQWTIAHKTKMGVSFQGKKNRIGGYSYLLPAYQQKTYSGFAMHQWEPNNQQMLEVGVRYDFAQLGIEGYYDKVLYDYLIGQNVSEEKSKSYAQRSQTLDKNFSNISYSIGYTYHLNKNYHSGITLSSNFRFPNAMELSANGLHHGAFRHEQGNANLDSEKGWAIDWNHQWQSKHFRVDLSLYSYYFSNYIFLKPTGTFSELPHGGQVYAYDQSRALISGFESQLQWNYNQWSATSVLEYIYTRQLSEEGAYPLPFSTPINHLLTLENRPFQNNEQWNNTKIKAYWKYYLAQNRIARNETTTPSGSVFGCSISNTFQKNEWTANIKLGVDNLLNTKYYEHNSFYRPLDIPALGRTFYLQIMFNY